MGRTRKKLEDKSTTLMIKLENRKIMELLDKYNIEYDRDAEIFNNYVKNRLIDIIRENL